MPVTPALAALDPPQAAVGGNNSKWISGDLLSQTGLNCSTAILGSAYTEIMVSGIASYGGLDHVPRVGEEYWTAFLISIPGNPCGSGSSSVVSTVILPPNTQVDQNRQIRCFGLGRSAGATWTELTGGSWSFLGSSGPYCPTQPSISPYHQGGLQIGFRPLANGQLFWLFVPVKSSAPLIGAGGPSPGHGFTWLTDATGVYANPGRSFVWANVLDSSLGSNPFVYFASEPAAIPYWKDDAPNDPGNGNITTKSRVEWLANLYSAGKTGTFCWELFKGAPDASPDVSACPPSGFPGWNGAIDTSGDLWQVFGSGGAAGPNGGYSPLYYDDDPPGTAFTVRWKFIPTVGPTVFKDAQFTTLAGPDQDGDGVANNGTDTCPTVKGTLPNGCLPAVQDDSDKDGVYGAADLCPNTGGDGALNGCPGGIIPNPPPPPPPPPGPKTLVATLLTKPGAVFKRASLARGAPVKFECTVDSAGSGTLSITKKIATRLGIGTKKKTVAIASGKGACRALGGGSMKIKLLRAYARKVAKAKKPFPATLAVKLTAPGQIPVTVKRGVKVR